MFPFRCKYWLYVSYLLNLTVEKIQQAMLSGHNIKMVTFLSALSKHKEPSLDCNFGKAQCFLLNANIGRKLLVDFNSKKYNKQY